MAHKSTYRKDKTCLNCGHVVAHKFCPNCGQENVDTRKTFYHLFVHFFEDLTHYENAFWKTIRNLFLKPASLSTEYLSGKRLSYLAPIRLYIFISFVTFFTVFVIDKNDLIEVKRDKNYIDKSKSDSLLVSNIGKIADSKLDGKVKNEKLIKILKEEKQKKKESEASITINGIKSKQQLDSLQLHGKEDEKLGTIGYWLVKKSFAVRQNNTDVALLEKGIASAKQNIPKVLILYMPFFAFFLWLFHGKKRWYYFDHGIYTLHYFSFLLLMVLILSILAAIKNEFLQYKIVASFFSILNLSGLLWTLYYFYSAHYRFYGESRSVSFIKSSVLLFINFFFVSIFLVLFFVYTFINIK